MDNRSKPYYVLTTLKHDCWISLKDIVQETQFPKEEVALILECLVFAEKVIQRAAIDGTPLYATKHPIEFLLATSPREWLQAAITNLSKRNL